MAGAEIIQPGTPVPELMLRREDGNEFTRADLEGATTVLVFYPFAFSPVCTDQLNLYEEVLSDFAAQGRPSTASPAMPTIRRARSVSISA